MTKTSLTAPRATLPTDQGETQRAPRIIDAFTAPDGSRKKAFIPFVTCGDPSLDVTERLLLAMQEAGADLIELGIPFSDPTAEGPVIQQANLRALAGGVTTDDVFAMVERVRAAGLTVPLVFMTYANVVYGYGIERFAVREREAGMQGIILPDVPFEEKAEFAEAFAAEGLDVISLIAPTSHERIRTIAREATGFVYVVSSLGVTGVRSEITTDIGAMVELIREANPDVPAAVGFGISTPAQAAKMAAVSDGAIVGSAIEKLLAAHGADAIPYVVDYIREMAAATHAA
ncbi:MAG: tryptophan synthase subunit alpha [Olegusella sp.]|nr:tryptophan synthase subunit alpha [Olegusella sp.]